MNKEIKHVLFIGNYPPPYGGVPHHIERLTAYLSKNNYHCHVLAGGSSGFYVRNKIKIYKPALLDKIYIFITNIFNKNLHNQFKRTHILKNFLRYWMRYMVYAGKGEEIIRKNKIDIIVSYNLLSYAPVGNYLSKKYNIPHVVNIFGEIYKNDNIYEDEQFFNEILNNAKKIISCSKHCGESIRLLNSKLEVATVVYGIDTNFFKGNTKIQIMNRTPKCVAFVGRISHEMGVDIFLEIIKNLSGIKGIRYLIVGQHGDMVERVQKYASDYEGDIEIVINCPYKNLPSYYAKADILVVPTRGDRTCSSLAAMEGMSAGCLVIANKLGGIPELIKDNHTGFLIDPPNDVSEFTRRIGHSLSFIDDFNDVRIRGHNFALQHYDESRMNKEMEKLITI